MRKLLMICVVSGFTFMCSHASGDSPGAAVQDGEVSAPQVSARGHWTRVDDSTLRFEGRIMPGVETEFMEIITPGTKTIVIKSGGGDVLTAIPVGEYILEHGLDVVVDGYCGSSAANYWFSMADRKTVKEDSWVGFHGGVDSGWDMLAREMRANMPAEAAEEMIARYTDARAREKAMYAKAGIDLERLQGRAEEVTREAYTFYVPTPAELREFGMKNIADMWFPADESRITELARKTREETGKPLKLGTWRMFSSGSE